MISPKKDEPYISSLLLRGEGESLDFKQSINSAEKIAKTLAAFANTSGGKLLVGVSDQKKITGIDEHEEMYIIDKAAKEFCHPAIQVEYGLYIHEEFKGKDEEPVEKIILEAIIHKSDQRHFVKNKEGQPVYYIRVMDRSLPKILD